MLIGHVRIVAYRAQRWITDLMLLSFFSPTTAAGVRMSIIAAAFVFLFTAGGEGSIVPPAAAEEATHGIAMHGRPALPDGFKFFPYVNPDAPKGGTATIGSLGTFDSLNPLIVKGVAASGVRELVYEGLLTRSADEPFTLYAGLAERVELPEDRRSVTFHLNPAAKFSDGHPVTADDVLFSWELLRTKGLPFHRSHYGNVAKADSPAPGVVHFTFVDNGNREAPLLLALMPVLPRHRTPPDTFERTTFDPPVGSGPYVVDRVDPGRSVIFRRNPDWWGRDLPVNRGRFNIDELRYEYFRDQTTLFEAFKTGEISIRGEDDATRWTEGYSFPAVTSGRVERLEVPTSLPAGMMALVFNTRRPVFADPRVRRALILMLDFEWINARLFSGAYARTQSYFERSDLSAHGRPADARETALLAPYRDRIKPEVMAGTYAMPVSDGRGNRGNLQAALKLLNEAGYVHEGTRLVHKATRQPLTFEMMAATRAEERLFQAFSEPLDRVGITTRIQLVDSAQRWARMKTFNFDMIQWTWSASLSPGNEQMNRWSTASAKTELSLNYAGVDDPAADALIDAMLVARERDEFVSATRAFDRLLISGDYVIPLYYAKGQWLAHWATLSHPKTFPLTGYSLDTWWATPAR